MKGRTAILALAVLGFAIIVAVQFNATHRLQSDVAAMRQELADLKESADGAPALPSSQPTSADRVKFTSSSQNQRLAGLEQAVAQLTRATDYLMERGQLPLANDKLDDIYRKLSDITASDRDRLQALRLLRRNKALSEEMTLQAVGWLQGATNSSTREDVLKELQGMTNALLLAPLLQIVAADGNVNVRKQGVDNLRGFISDPEVEARLWNLLRTEPSEKVRDHIANALRDAPVSEARQAALRQRALNPEASVDERLAAMRALDRVKSDTPEVTAAMIQLAQNAQDPLQRVKLFRAFNGSDNPVLKLPLVHGLQDPNPLVRQGAADALKRYNSDPAVQQWLRHVASTDADPRVQREALRSLEKGK